MKVAACASRTKRIEQDTDGATPNSKCVRKVVTTAANPLLWSIHDVGILCAVKVLSTVRASTVANDVSVASCDVDIPICDTSSTVARKVMWQKVRMCLANRA